MKKIIILVLSTTCSFALAADNRQVQRSLQEIDLAQQQAQIIFNTTASLQDKERIRYVSDRLTSAQDILNQSLNAPPPPYRSPPSNPGNSSDRIEFYHSDSCSSELVMIVDAWTDCDSLGSSSVWGVKIRGVCSDIADTSAVKACKSFKALSQPQAVKIYHSDSCSSELVAAVDRNTVCEDLRGLANAWAIQTNGQCQDISDTDIVTACNRFK